MSVRVGILGAGNISSQYLENLTRFPDLDVALVADVEQQRARSRAEEFGVERWGSPEDLLASDVELVVNLTPPALHVDTSIAALDAGKLVWSEKPLALDGPAAQQLLRHAEEGRLACAPDTVLGPGAQTWLRVLRDGVLGEVTSGFCAFTSAGPQLWHPNPAFLFQPGAGPMFDMGPYYLTWLIHALGPVAQVTARASRARTVRTIGSGELKGTQFPVEVSTTTHLFLDFEQGAHVTALFSFDSAVKRKHLELTGSMGTIVAPDPNGFGGDVVFTPASGDEPRTWSVEAGPTRGLGALELARAAAAGRRPRAAVDVAAHVVEILCAAEESAEERRPVGLSLRPKPIDLLPEDWDPLSDSDLALASGQSTEQG